ncbi:MAG: YceH family protein [Solirubrobacteraceae bacterium]
MDLSPAEIRVLGCLLEKQRTTPDHYPLSLNSLRLACNQSTNREPVVDYDEAIVRDTLHRLERRGFTRLAGASRAAKYRHLLSQALPMSDAEQAIVCVLMLRGPQTPGELKQRGERIHAFADLEEVHATLADLIGRDLVARLERRPGQKEERYSQLLGEDAQPESGAGSFAPARRSEEGIEAALTIAHTPELAERVAQLEREVGELRATLVQLLERTGLEGAGSAGTAMGGGPALESAVAGAPAFESVGGDPAPERDSREAEGGQPEWSEEVAQHNP